MAKANDKAVNEISVRTLKVARKHRPYYAPVGSPHNLPYRHYPDVPGLRLTGHWLEEAGFKMESHVRVEVHLGKLIITPA